MCKSISSKASRMRKYNLCTKLVSLLVFTLFLIACKVTAQQQQPALYHHHNHHRHKTSEESKPITYQHVLIFIPDLPPAHYQYWLKTSPLATRAFEEICKQVGSKLNEISLVEFQRLHSNLSFENQQYLQQLDYGKEVLSHICPKISDVTKLCWGYENNCQDIYLMPECHATSMKREEQEKIAWFSQADFGYILDKRKELGKFCAPDKKANPEEVSSFECTKQFTSCRGSNLYAKFDTSILSNSEHSANSGRLQVLNQLGGWSCDLQRARIKEESSSQGRYGSWYDELKSYSLVDHLNSKDSCDIVFKEQVFFVKISSYTNFDEYLSTFINLYATMHMYNRFSEDTRIIIWDKHMPQKAQFAELWYAFSRLPPITIGELDGKRVCFKKFIFAMPPNMIDGLYSDKPLVEGCRKSGLYAAFQKHVVHRLRVPDIFKNYPQKTQTKLVRIAILSRASKSEFRNIINENELTAALRQSSSNSVNIIRYNSLNFGKVLFSIIHSDIVIGLHGSGLAYSLFLPDWAGLIELHDCGKDRYRKLARLRGISYFKPSQTIKAVKKIRVAENSVEWPLLNKSRLLDNDEFSNYEINIEQFLELFNEVRDHVLEARNNHFEKLKSAPPAGSETITGNKSIEKAIDATKPSTAPNTEEPSTRTPTRDTRVTTNSPTTEAASTKFQTTVSSENHTYQTFAPTTTSPPISTSPSEPSTTTSRAPRPESRRLKNRKSTKPQDMGHDEL